MKLLEGKKTITKISYQNTNVQLWSYNTLPSRYIVATRDIRAGEIIFEESPLAVGPNAVSTPQCIMCHSKVSSTYSVPVYDDDIS